MSASDRQNRLLVAEDWKRIYQSFQNADFQSYDFENLRRVMISYIRENYPEDFNDYIESSEYLALIDVMAFLGQSLSFRIDLNARDNFLELAERRESVLRLSRLLGYKPKRNIASSGLLKFTTVATTQQIIDSNGRNISNQTISWNDPTNPNWYDQFIKILNAALPVTQQFGNSALKDNVYGIPTESYRFQSTLTDVPVFEFSKSVDGRSMTFEIISTTFSGRNEIYEEPPLVGNSPGFIYRDDGKGTASTNTGFFIMFKEGTLTQGTFTLDQPAPDETVDIEVENINNSDVWLYKLDSNGRETELWTPVPELEGNNIIYNSLKKSIKNIYNVVTRTNDKVSLLFSDGVFGNLPKGTFRVYYRTSNGLSYTITPRDIRNVTIDIPYTSHLGRREVLTVTLALQSSVANSSPAESSASIKQRAPATFYTQNRMITAEDYNISPLSVNQEVVKVKSVNRSASGISRYFDLVDPTGKYSKTNLFADDGVLYRQYYTDSFKFRYNTRTDIEAIIYNQLIDVLKQNNLKHFYYSNFDRKILTTLNAGWTNVTTDINQCTGYVKSLSSDTVMPLGSYTSTLLSFFAIGSLVKFTAPAGKYFDKSKNNQLVTATGQLPSNSSTFLWSKVIRIAGDGTNKGSGILVNGTGAVVLNDVIPTGSVLSELIPPWRIAIDDGTVRAMSDLIFSNKVFGLRYDTSSLSWKLITETNLNLSSSFSLARAGDLSNSKLDSSWLILFTTDSEYYTVKYRLCRYIFESDQQIRFFFDSSDKIYDARNNKTVKDLVRVLGVNQDPGDIDLKPFTYDRDWEITQEFVGLDGYVDSKKIQLTFADTDDDGIVDDPTLFEQIVQPGITPLAKYVVLEKYKIEQGQEDYRYVSNRDNKVTIAASENAAKLLSPVNNQYFYFVDTASVVKYSTATSSFVVSLDYKVFQGRDNLKFQYIHNADYESRIDPGITNLVDTYILTNEYDVKFRQWLNNTIDTEPLPPSADFLYNLLSPDLNKIKSLSDEIIYHPVKYKVLFGKKADSNLQATFKLVKNSEVVISDNDLKTRVLDAINRFFSLENWDFGDNFFFSELSAFVMKELSPNLVNFTIVPKQPELSFGNLFEIRAEKDQIFINGATIDNIEIIPTITASSINSGYTIEQTNTVVIEQKVTSARSN